ncbi:hypothetical protein V5799_033510 [Amblyomma americanum]|uniref:Uncharacterized protein n=1 Tax=Amblyomma americanum TaxID=6943 RepID=A0AAQ4DN43_AMBAM
MWRSGGRGKKQEFVFRKRHRTLSEPESKALEQALGCAAKVKICHRENLGDFMRSVYGSLALNQSLRSLHVDFKSGSTVNDGSTPSSALCAALKACGCLRSFQLDVHRAYDENEETAPLLAKIFDALTCNRRLRKFTLVTFRLTFKIAQLLSALVGQFKTSLVVLRIVSTGNMSDAVLGVLQRMISKNVFLSRVSVSCSAWKDVVGACAAVDDAKEQNRGALNNAAKFVMSLDREAAASAKDRCASAFDELCGTASLREHLVSLSGKSELQVSRDVKAARRHVEDNYMIYAGVVRATVLCEAGDGSTQFDELNVGCWRSIVQYLKLSDVVS